jgi:hypothetical protein
LLYYFFLFGNKADKIPSVLATFFSFAGDFLNAIRTVLAKRHRSHHSGGLTTEGEEHDYRKIPAG